MPRAAPPEVRLVPLGEALARLGNISDKTFDRYWREVFTPRRADGRASGGRKKPIVVLSDELDVAVLEGRDAVLTYRMEKGRLAKAA